MSIKCVKEKVRSKIGIAYSEDAIYNSLGSLIEELIFVGVEYKVDESIWELVDNSVSGSVHSNVLPIISE